MMAQSRWAPVIALSVLASCTAYGQDKPAPKDNSAPTTKDSRATTTKDNPAAKIARKARDLMRDPDSFRVNSVILRRVTHNSAPGTVTYICVEFRSKNAFGGYANGHLSAGINQDSGEWVIPGNTSGVWDSIFDVVCVDKPGDKVESTDMTEEAKAALKADREKEEAK